MMEEAMLKVEDLNVYYGSIHALKGVSFEVAQGEIVTLIGANGAGKTTTLNTICGLLHSKTGDVRFEGKSIARRAPNLIVSDGIAHCPEGRRIFARMTVEENLQMGGYVRTRDDVNESLPLVYKSFPRLEERRKQLAGTLSGGEQQMLAMGRAIMSKPKLLILDEPSMGLAPILVEQIFEMIKTFHSQGTTILLVEQNARMALSVADRGYVLETGHTVISGTGAELMSSDAVKKAYLGG